MKSVWRLSLLLTICIGSSVKAQPTVIEVAQPNAGALRETLSAIKDLRAGGMIERVTIQLVADRYEFDQALTLDPKTVGDGLTITGPDKGEAIFSAAIQLQGTRDGEVWTYPIPESWWQAMGENAVAPRAIVVDGKLRRAARFPNEGYLRIEKALEDRRSGFIAKLGDLPAELSLGEDVCDLILLHDWSSSRMPVAKYDAKVRVLRTFGPIGSQAKHYAIDHFEKQPRYWLEGHPDFADQPGEWYFDREQKRIVLKGNHETAPPQVELPLLEEMLIASGNDESSLNGLVLKKITFRGTKFAMTAGGLAGSQATMHERRNPDGSRKSSARSILNAGVRIEQATNCVVQQCRFEAMGGSGLWIGSRTNNCRLIKSSFTDIGGNAINMGEDSVRREDGKVWYQSKPEQIATGNIISECNISFCGQLLPGAVAIWAPHNKQLRIEKNHIHDCPYTGISTGWVWNDSNTPAGENLIEGNRIEYVMQVLSDGGGIYTLGKQPRSVIQNNVITDVPLNAGRAESNGMFLDQGSTGFTIRHNTIRRVDRSPIRFHQAGKNIVRDNLWELATPTTPPVRFNNTPEENITIEDNTVLEPQPSIYVIGNSLTWDTIPSKLDGNVKWHVDCGKSLTYIRENPSSPCVSSSRIWSIALPSAQFDFVSVQPHYGTTIEEDLAVISNWMEQQPTATFIIHTGWGKHAQLVDEYADTDPAGTLTHSTAYFDTLIEQLQAKHPDRTIRCTNAMLLVKQIMDDIAQDKAPFKSIEEIYRDAIHMNMEYGRYMMHNAMRNAVGQPRTTNGFPEIDKEIRSYLDGVLSTLPKHK